MAPTAIRDRRCKLRCRHQVLRQAVQMKNRVSGLLMETGVSSNRLLLQRMGYFRNAAPSGRVTVYLLALVVSRNNLHGGVIPLVVCWRTVMNIHERVGRCRRCR